ncbi:histone H1-like [Coregonus clupeaformis]|uniref:histone H1-like n=1 Tax=Coregonus clupeaformis TaxID=59861 RepID=UPI001E1C2BE3|nr:histone H1-like [Coregonus clupeaformis]
MAEVAPAPAAAAPAKAPKKKAAAKPKKAGPSVGRAHRQGCDRFQERSGVSLAAQEDAGGRRLRRGEEQLRVKIAVKSLVPRAPWSRPRGTGASGSFQAQQESCRGEEARQESRSPQSKEGGRQEAPCGEEAQEGSSQEGRRRKEVPKKAKKPATPKKAAKSPKKVKKPDAAAKKAAKSPKKATKAAKPKAAKPKAAKPKKK